MKRLDINKKKKYKTRKKTVIGAVIISSMLFINIGVVFADGDVNAVLNNWFNKKTTIAKTEIEKSVKSETELQKQRITKELKLKMEASSKDLDKFTEEEKAKRKQAVIDYASNIINNTKFSNEADKKQIQDKLNVIVESAKNAMDNLNQSYNPPKQVYEAPNNTNSQQAK